MRDDNEIMNIAFPDDLEHPYAKKSYRSTIVTETAFWNQVLSILVEFDKAAND